MIGSKSQSAESDIPGFSTGSPTHFEDAGFTGERKESSSKREIKVTGDVFEINQEPNFQFIEIKTELHNENSCEINSQFETQSEYSSTDGTSHEFLKDHNVKIKEEVDIDGNVFDSENRIIAQGTTDEIVETAKECDKEFDQLSTFKSNFITHDELKKPTPVQCHIDMTWSKSDTLETQRGLKPHICMHCDKAFTSASYLRKHSITHSTSKPHKCTHCNKSFKQVKHLKYHILTHTGVRAYTCPQCPKTFGRVGSLKRHMSLHSGVKTHKCQLCGKMFIQAERLKCHMLTHSVKTHQCMECDKSFYHRGALKRHLLMAHGNVKPHKCIHCDKAFSEFGQLKLHISTHNITHKCTECGKTFKHADKLRIHLVTHNGVRAHKCTECGKTFSRADTLKTHLVTHSEIRAFTCIQCGKTFKLSRSVKRHLLNCKKSNDLVAQKRQ